MLVPSLEIELVLVLDSEMELGLVRGWGFL